MSQVAASLWKRGESLRTAHLLAVQFMLCEVSKYFFYLEVDSGRLYRPRGAASPLSLTDYDDSAFQRMMSMWTFLQQIDAGADAADISATGDAARSADLASHPDAATPLEFD